MWLTTSRGVSPEDRRYVSAYTLTADEVRTEDIIGSLAHQNRYIGHVGTYSVAQHSVLVMREVARLLDGRFDDDSDVYRSSLQWGLMHDASEAYIGDWPAPLKHSNTEMARAFNILEDRVQGVIAAAYGLPASYPVVVKLADKIVLATEARDFFGATRAEMDTDWHLEGVDPSDEEIIPWTPAMSSVIMRQMMEARGLRARGERDDTD